MAKKKSNIEIFQDELDKTVRANISIKFKSGDDISVPLIQFKCACGYFSAQRVYNEMLKDGTASKDPAYPNGVGKLK